MTSFGGSGIECPKCGRKNDDRTRFCDNCGLEIDGRCPNCSKQNAAGSVLCSLCGFDFVEGQVIKPKIPLGDLRTRGAGQTGGAGLGPGGRISRPTSVPGQPAALGVRVGGLFIDALVITGIYAMLAPGIINESLSDAFSGISDGSQSSASFILDSVVSWGYGTALLTIWATTVGKRVFRVRVVRFDGTRLGLARAAARELVKVVAFASLLLAVVTMVMVAVRPDKRGLHDLISGTVVVKR